MNLRYPTVALCLAFAAAAISSMALQSAGAADAPPGSKNFNSPGSVPNYFSNEAAPFVASPNPHPAPAEPAPARAAPAPERATPLVVSPYARPHQVRTAKTVRGRPARSARATTARRHSATAVSTKGRAPARTAHAARPAKSKSAAVKARPVSAGGRRAGRG